MKLEQICKIIKQKYKIFGDINKTANKASSLINNDENSIVFCTNPEMLNENIKASIIICNFNSSIKDKLFIIVENPRLAFIRIMKYIYSKKSISPSISFDALVDTHLIGNSCTIHPNVHIYSNVRIGNFVNVFDGTIIGKSGFSFEKNNEGELEMFPHIGDVRISDNVYIGANCVIDRGTLDSTIIREGCRINNFVHIGHNNIIDKNCDIHGRSFICGGSKIGENTTIYAGSIIKDGITIGKNCIIGMGSLVTKSIPNNTLVYGSPAKEIRKV